MVELVNAADSKFAGGNTLRVRVSLPAPEFRHRPLRQVLFFLCPASAGGGASARTGGLSSGKSSAGIFLFMFRKACRPCRLRERTAGPDAQLGGENSPFLPLKRRAFSACSAFFGKWPGIVMLPRVREEMGVRFSCFTGEKAGTSVVPVWAGGLFTVSSFLYHARKS